MRLYVKYLVVGLTFIVLNSGLKAQADLRTVFNAPECQTACWEGMQPGVTTQAEVQANLNSLGIPYRASWLSGYTEANGTYYFLLSGSLPYTRSGSANIQFGNSKVVAIKIPVAIPLSEVIQTYGSPDYTNQGFDGYELAYLNDGILFTVDNVTEEVNFVELMSKANLIGYKDDFLGSMAIEVSCLPSATPCPYATATATPTLAPGSGTGLRADLYDNADLSGLALTRTDAQVDFDWGTGAPDALIAADTFSVRWSGTVTPRFSELYTFTTQADDGVRLWVNGQRLIDDWTVHPVTTQSRTIALTAGQPVPIVLEYFEDANLASIRLLWSSASTPQEVVPQTQLDPPASVTSTPSLTPTRTPTATPTLTRHNLFRNNIFK